VTFTVIGVSQDEPPLGQGSGDRSPDATLATVPNTVNVRAERSGEGDGRVYQIGFTATAGDLTCTSTVTVGVPHDQHSGPATDSGQRYDSFGH
jgi:hypothetical protein